MYIYVAFTGTSADHDIRKRLRYADHQAMWNSEIQTNMMENQNGGSGKKKKILNMRVLRLKSVF